MIELETLKETETGGVKTFVRDRIFRAVSTANMSRAVDIGGAYTEQDVLTFTTGYDIQDGVTVRAVGSGKMYRVTAGSRHGMAGLKRYEAVRVYE